MIDLAELRAQFPTLKNITPLASGGQKEVCRADLGGNPVALKLILPVFGAEERTRREIEASQKLSSSYVPKVFETGDRTLCGQKRDYIIEQFIDGHTYRALLQQNSMRDFVEVL